MEKLAAEPWCPPAFRVQNFNSNVEIAAQSSSRIFVELKLDWAADRKLY